MKLVTIVMLLLGIGAVVTWTLWLSGATEEDDETTRHLKTFQAVQEKAKAVGMELNPRQRGGRFVEYEATGNLAACDRLLDDVRAVKPSDCWVVSCGDNRLTGYQGGWWLNRLDFPNCASAKKR